MTLKQKLGRVLLINAGLQVLGMIGGILYDAHHSGADAVPQMAAIVGIVYAAGVLAVANVLVGFFLVLGTATLEVSELRGWGKAMLIAGPILVVIGAVVLGLFWFYFLANFRIP